MNLAKTNEPWLDVVPDDWKRSRIKNVSVLSPGYSGHPPRNDELYAVVPMENVSDNGIVDTTDQINFEDIQSGLTLFEKGDVLFAKITPCMENGKGAFVESLPTQYAFGSTEFHVLRPSHAVDGKFLYFYTLNSVFRAYAAENMSGAAGQKRVSSRFIKDTRLFLPPLPEQRRIAAYLGKTCAAIDAAIEKKQKQLETLDALRKSIILKAVTRGLDDSVELKDAGIEWSKLKPSHWKTCRLKDEVDFFNTVRVPLSADVRGAMTDRIYEYYGASGVIDKVEDYLFNGSYILIAEDGANLLARNSPLAFLATGKFWVNNHAHILKPRFGNIHYFVYLLESLDYSLYVTGAAQPKLTKENLGKYKIIVPPRTEQNVVTDYLDAKTAEISELIQNIMNQITVLLEYRKSLIHECVTGKRRITEDDLQVIHQH